MNLLSALRSIPSRLKTRFVPLDIPAPVAFPKGKTAVLVIHGMGAQKPYATLDQFARGIMDSYRAIPTQREVVFHQWKKASIGSQKDWTQTLLRITPLGATTTDQVIDVYEYYWAPVITGLVTARQSLLFLLGAALSPFEYLRDNLNLINDTANAAPPPGSPLKLRLSTGVKRFCTNLKRGAFVLFRELVRMAVIYLPFIAIIFLLLYLIGAPFQHSVANNPVIVKIIHTPPGLTLNSGVKMAAAAVRYLLLFSSGLFLFQTIWPGNKGSAKVATPLYPWLMGGFFLFVLSLPYWISWARLDPHLKSFHALGSWLLSLPAILWGVIEHHPLWSMALAVLLAATTVFNPWGLAAWRGLKNLWKHWEVSLALGLLAVAAAFAWRYFSQHPAKRAPIENSGHWLAGVPSAVHITGVLEYGLLAVLFYVLNGFLTSAIGGLAVYLGADDLSKNAAARAMILHESTETILKLLDRQPDLVSVANSIGEYDKVLIASHSLGTVIAMDMLNQLIVRRLADDPALIGAPQTACTPLRPAVQLDKIAGLLTFGSPLNKAVYFFRTRVSTVTTVLERILFQLHPFRVCIPLSQEANGPVPVPEHFPNATPFSTTFQWFNAWSHFDLISGKMFFYHCNRDVTIERGITPWTAHLSYWENPELYNLFSQLL